jgi:hypothetical protein
MAAVRHRYGAGMKKLSVSVDARHGVRFVGAMLLVAGLAACSGTAMQSTSDDEPSSSMVPASGTAEAPAVAPSHESAASDSPTPRASGSFPAGERPGDPIGPPEIATGDWVVSTVEGLRLREQPGLGGASIGLLRIGYEGTVVEGPVELDGHEWIHVAWPGLPAASGCATGPDADGYLSFCGQSGWLATADELGNPWVERTMPECPDRPATVREAAELRPGVRLACFGGEQLTLTGFMAPEAQGRGCYLPYDHGPAWLGPCAVVFVQGEESQFDATTWELAVNVHADLGECHFGGRSPDECPFLPYLGGWVEMTGMLDHPASESCEVEPWAGVESVPDAASVIYDCRERFVVTAIDAGVAP